MYEQTLRDNIAKADAIYHKALDDNSYVASIKALELMCKLQETLFSKELQEALEIVDTVTNSVYNPPTAIYVA